MQKRPVQLLQHVITFLVKVKGTAQAVTGWSSAGLAQGLPATTKNNSNNASISMDGRQKQLKLNAEVSFSEDLNVENLTA